MAATRKELGERFKEFADFVVDFQKTEDAAVPESMFARCRGVVILRQYRAGLGFGFMGGSAVALLHREDGSWSPPAFYREGSASVGLQAGGERIEAIILVMNPSGVDKLMDTQFAVNAEASASAGPAVRGDAEDIGENTAFLLYSRAKGVFAGAVIEGGVMMANDSANQALYGPGAKPRDILMNDASAMPEEARVLVSALGRYTPMPIGSLR